jgi:hypothetical protein
MNRKALLLAFCLGVPMTPAVAGPREDVMDASDRCAAVTDDRQWLDCYYGAAQAMRAHLGLSPAPPGQLALVPPPGKAPPPRAQAAQPASQPAQEGFFGRLVAHDELNREPQMVAYSFDKAHRFTVTLSDGTTWRQSLNDTHRAVWQKPPASYRVSVSRGHGGIGILDANDGFQYEVQQVN